MNLEEKLPNLRRHLDEQPFHLRFRLGDICHEDWHALTPGEQSQLGRGFRLRVMHGVYPDIVNIGKLPIPGMSQEYIRLAM